MNVTCPEDAMTERKRILDRCVWSTYRICDNCYGKCPKYTNSLDIKGILTRVFLDEI